MNYGRLRFAVQYASRFCGVFAAIFGTSAVAGGLAEKITEVQIEEVVTPTQRGWHLLGVEGTVSYADLPGQRILNVAPSTGERDVTYSITSLDLALNFASGDLGPDRGRWIVSPFYSFGVDGVEDLEGLARTDTDDGEFEWQELGLRVEREQYITDIWSWTAGVRAAYVDSDVILENLNNGNLFTKANEGQHLGVFLGANAKLTDDFTAVSRVGYSWVDLNESSECIQTGGPTSVCTDNPGNDDDDSDLEGFEASLGVRYTF